MKLRKIMPILLCTLCLLLGFGLLFGVLNRLQSDVVAQHEEKMADVATSVDISAQNKIFVYRESLAYVAERRGFVSAESIWLETGDEAELLLRIQENLLMQGLQAANFLVVDETGICMSATGETSYRFPDTDEDLFLCADEAGHWFLGIRYTKPRVTYIVLTDLAELSQELAEGSSITDTARLLLVDRDGQAVICFHDGTPSVFSAAEAKLEEYPPRAMAYAAADTDLREVSRIKMTDSDGTKTMGYSLMGSLATRNGFFTVCVLDSYDAQLKSLRENALWIIIGCILLAAGILMAVRYTTILRRENRYNTRELQRLKQREEALEKINQQAAQLAHHQRLETIGTLTSSISHEFNNLLTPIMSYSLLTLEKLPAEEEELYDNIVEIYNASQKAKVIISRLSDLSRKNSPKTFRSISVDEQIKKSLEIAMPAKPEGVEIKLDLNCWDLHIRANEIQITQMLLNLILNAFQAMESGGVLEIGTTFNDDHIYMNLLDNGSGIPEEIRDKVFDPFFTTKESGKGTGLGLAIVAQVVEDHQGTVELHSTLGQGTQFKISLPRQMKTE